MTTYSVRCKNASCRHRRVSHTHPDDYKIVPKCLCCGHRKGWRIEARAYNQRGLCNCSSVVGDNGPFTHRKGRHEMCDHHPHGYYNQAKRAGVLDEDIPLEALCRKVNQHEAVPF